MPPHQIAAATTGLNSTGLGLSAYLEDIVSDEELDEIEATPPTNAESGHHLHGKDELLTMMDKVDRDITLIEQMIQSLEKKQVGVWLFDSTVIVYGVFSERTV